MNKVAVIGGGSWGTAIAFLLGKKGLTVNFWVYEPELVDIIRKQRENTMYLPGIKLPESIIPTNSFQEALSGQSVIVWVTPSHTIRATLNLAKDHISNGAIFIGASKGIENKTLMRVSEIAADTLKGNPSIRYVTLSGPTFARDVAMEQPTTAVVAGHDTDAARTAQHLLNSHRFRVYLNSDHIGVELGGAVKNVIAIAVGIATGLNLGSNTRAALITRGLWEIVRLGKAMGANPMTFLGLSGMGDLVLTCDGTQSRNFRVGRLIGSGMTLDEIQSSMNMVAEGVKTTKSVRELGQKFGVEMPITEEVYQVLYFGKSPQKALEDLMSRSLKFEHQTDETVPDEFRTRS